MRKQGFIALVYCTAFWLMRLSNALAGQTQATERQGQTASQQTLAKAAGQQATRPRRPVIPPGMRLLSLREGHAFTRNISWADDEEGLAPDCSHLVHTLYEQGGYSYPYASSTDLYHGTGQARHFLRVRYPHAGDLIVWPGHVGIVMNPVTHSFFSTTSEGARTENYRSAYWRARGYARFYRYLVSKSTRNKGKTGLTEVNQQETITKVPD